MATRYRITSTDLRHMVNETVRRVLSETISGEDNPEWKDKIRIHRDDRGFNHI